MAPIRPLMVPPPAWVEDLVTILQDHLQKSMATTPPPTFRATITGSSTKPGHVQIGDGVDYPVLTTYSSNVLGATGGPALGDDVFMLKLNNGIPAIAFKVPSS